jgi:hypothetical protein
VLGPKVREFEENWSNFTGAHYSIAVTSCTSALQLPLSVLGFTNEDEATFPAFTGHGSSGLEGMASGITTIAKLEDEAYTLQMRRWSFLDECPLVSATPENITDVLRELVTNPKLRKEPGCAGREYVEKYHGLDSAQYLF